MYKLLIPEAVIEPPYKLSMITLYDSKLNLLWDWGCKKDDDCEEYDFEKVKVMVDKEIKQQGVYKQWEKPIELNTKS